MSDALAERQARRNVRIYTSVGCLRATALFWSLTTLLYAYRGLSFLDIALLQSVGSIAQAVLEVPSGWVSDRFGHKATLVISSAANALAVALLAFAQGLPLLLVSELLFSLGFAAQSGSDSALLFESLRSVGEEGSYREVIARVTKRQSVLRLLAKLVGPALYAIAPSLPFAVSIIPYVAIFVTTLGYSDVSVTGGDGDEKGVSVARGMLLGLKSGRFLSLALLSAVALVVVSNFSQYSTNWLEGVGLDVALLGVVSVVASAGEYVGARIAQSWLPRNGLWDLIVPAIVMCASVLLASALDSVAGVSVAYFLVNGSYAVFSINLGAALQNAVLDESRATMLSVESQFEDVVSVVADPVVGAGLDALGFRGTFAVLSVIAVAVFSLAGIVLRRLGGSGDVASHE